MACWASAKASGSLQELGNGLCISQTPLRELHMSQLATRGGVGGGVGGMGGVASGGLGALGAAGDTEPSVTAALHDLVSGACTGSASRMISPLYFGMSTQSAYPMQAASTRAERSVVRCMFVLTDGKPAVAGGVPTKPAGREPPTSTSNR